MITKTVVCIGLLLFPSYSPASTAESSGYGAKNPSGMFLDQLVKRGYHQKVPHLTW